MVPGEFAYSDRRRPVTSIRVYFVLLAVLFAVLCSCGDGDADRHRTGGEVDRGGITPDSDSGLSRDDFRPLVQGGIDDRLNSYPWAMATFDGDGDGVDEVYIGTLSNALCLQVPFGAGASTSLPTPRPPSAWQCDVSHWNPGNWLPFYLDNLSPPVVFRGRFDAGTDAWTWDRVFEPSVAECAGFRGAIVFDGALYMLGAATGGAFVFKSVDGVTWERASEPGVVAEHAGYNKLLRAAAVFHDRLYVASSSPTSSYIYASNDPAPGNWEVVDTNGFVASGGSAREVVETSGRATGVSTRRTLSHRRAGWVPFYFGGRVFDVRIVAGTGAGQQRTIVENAGTVLWIDPPWDEVPDRTSEYEIVRENAPDNGPIYQMAVFDDRLFVGPFNYQTGAELWASADPRPGGWERVIAGGFHNPGTEGFMTVVPFGDSLYLGTVVYPANFTSPSDISGTEVLRVDAAGTVELLVGAKRFAGTADEIAPLTGMAGGFDYRANVYSWNAAVHDGTLYWGTFDVGGLALDYVDQVFPLRVPDLVDDLLRYLLGPDRERWGGFDLWRTRDGADWTPISLDGFEDVENYGVRSFASTPDGLLIGVANPYAGFELWLGE